MGDTPVVLPTLTINRLFVSDLMAASAPCFAMGYVEVEGQSSVSGFLALRPDEPISAASSDRGFDLAHCALGRADRPVFQFTFEFYGHDRYHALVNPSNPIVREVLNTMVDTEDYFFFALNPDHQVTAFRSHLEHPTLVGLRTNLENFGKAVCPPEHYERVCQAFAMDPDPPGRMMEWVCRDNPEYLDLTQHRVALNPR